MAEAGQAGVVDGEHMTEKGPTADVAIIGAGIVGVATAIWLQRAGASVVLIDKVGPAGGASEGNGGVLASCASVPVTTPGLLLKAPRMLLDPNQPLFLRWSYLPRLLPWLVRYLRHANEEDTRRIARAIHGLVGDSLADHQALAEGTGAEHHIVPCDYYYAYASRRVFEADAFPWSVRRELGATWQEIDDLRAVEPALSPALGFGVRLGHHGRISDPGQYVRDLARHVVSEGGDLVTGEVSRIATTGSRTAGVVMADGRRIETGAVVLAAGIGSSPLAKQLGLRVPLETERGYHVEFWDPEGAPRTCMMIAAGKFVATPMNGRLRLAGVIEFGGTKAPPSRAPVAFLERQARRVFPDLKSERVTRWMGHRPAIADSIPVIGAVPGIAGAYAAFGHHHIGLTSGAKTGRLLAALISGRRGNIDLTPYSPSRYARRRDDMNASTKQREFST